MVKICVDSCSHKKMERCVIAPARCQVALSDILGLQAQPVCEEQAWALCYQLCSLLENNFNQQVGYKTWKSFRLPGLEGVLFSPDGSISLRIDTSQTEEEFVIETEDQTVDYVGRLMYSCLDWGLGADVERELDETLELLVGQMTKVEISLGSEHCLQPVCTISEVLQVCEERLYNPSQVVQHYRSVCATLYSHTIELCHYLQVIQQTRGSLQKMIMESAPCLVQNVTTTWDFAWKHLIEELNRGVVLRPPKHKVNTGTPVQMDSSPFNQLLQDIQLRRYSLRKVQALGQSSGERKSDPHQALLTVIRARPKLRPVSERSLKQRAPNPKQEVSLHELLMQEIRSADPTKLLASRKGRRSARDSGCSTLNSLKTSREDFWHNDASFMLSLVPDSHPEGTPCREADGEGNSSRQDIFADSSDRTLRFLPALSSTPLSLSGGCSVARGKRRTRSFVSSQELCWRALKSKVSVSMTIAEVIKTHYSKQGTLKSLLCDAYRSWRVCSCCSKRSLFFTWHNCCSLCSRVVCPECCVELSVPFKWCINLPMSFFKKIVVTKDCEQSQKNFWDERWSWDSSWVPLVLVSWLPSTVSPHALAMRDWHSQEVCVGCQVLLLAAVDSVVPRGSQEI